MNLKKSCHMLVVLAGLTFLPINTYAKKADAVKNDLKDVHQQIESLKKELNASTLAKEDAADALKASELAISEAKKKLYDINKKQKDNVKTLNKLSKKSQSISQQLAHQQQQLSKLLYQQYTHGKKSYTQLILEHQDPNTIARDIRYYSYITKAHSELIASMQSNLDEIQQVNKATNQTLAQVKALKEKQEAEKQALEVQKAEKANVVKSLSKKISQQRNQISKLKRDEKSLSKLFKRLTTAAAKPKKPKPQSNQSQEKASPNTNNPPKAIAKNNTLPSNDYDGVKFSSLRGKLRLPVRGDVTNRFGASRAETGVSWKGLFIRSSEGSEVKSVAGGKVVFADWMRGFGNLLIIDHGSGYMSLYGNNQALLKNVGDQVTGGETIAAVGNTGGNETNGLYYELRKNSVPFDPMSWSH